jgi:hypothetical protein
VGVTTSDTLPAPITSFFARGPVVPRALRVAARFATAIAFSSAVIGARTLRGASPKSARTSAELPNVNRTNAVAALMSASNCGIWPLSASTFARALAGLIRPPCDCR